MKIRQEILEQYYKERFLMVFRYKIVFCCVKIHLPKYNQGYFFSLIIILTMVYLQLLIRYIYELWLNYTANTTNFTRQCAKTYKKICLAYYIVLFLTQVSYNSMHLYIKLIQPEYSLLSCQSINAPLLLI